ncbi:YhcN/YlaJ family sporulation lipoprotein [Paenibacillus sp. TRM 82003]|nr:YhcN/YlaJ family sporulation lipoprotein [Paenibacillus sp. TRM 82003]
MERWTKMFKKILRFTVIGASALALAACGAGNGAGNAGGDMSQNGVRTNYTGNGVGMLGNRTNDAGMGAYGNHNNRNLQTNVDLARAIERLDGISRANVVLGETNAYVAVEVDRNAGTGPALGGSNARTSQDAQSYGIKGNYYGATDSRVLPNIAGHGANGQTGGRAASSNRGTAEMYGYTTGGANRGYGVASGYGAYGTNGTNGTNGLNGINGYGANGMNGRGASGYGANGTNGLGGTTGLNGATGTGTTGLDGATGTSNGTNGNGLIGGGLRMNGANGTMQGLGMTGAQGGRNGQGGQRGLSSSVRDMNSGAQSYGTAHQYDLGGNMDYGRYDDLSGRTGAIGTRNRTNAGNGNNDNGMGVRDRMGASNNGMGARGNGTTAGVNNNNRYDGLSGRVGLNRTGINGGNGSGTAGTNNGAMRARGVDDAGSHYMYNGGTYGYMNAYQNNFGLSSQIRARVEAIVRQHAPSVRNVYVSADSNFMERMSTYSGRLGDGRNPVRGLMNEFNEFVGGIFTEALDNDGATGTGTREYDLNLGYNDRNRNGVTRQMDNSFDVDNPRHRTGMDMTRTPAGTIQSVR